MRLFLCTVLGLCIGALAGPANAQEDFYQGKQITLVVGVPAGGTPDLYGRLLVNHMGKHIPGRPTFIVQNLPGADGLVAMQTMLRSGPHDGTAMGTIASSPIQDWVLNPKYELSMRDFQWLGSMNKETQLVAISSDAPVKSFADVFNVETIVAASSERSDNFILPNLMNELLGTKFKVVAGYSSGAEMDLAMARGEVHGRAGVSWGGLKVSMADQLQSGKIKVLLQMALEPNQELAGVPSLLDYIKKDEDRRVVELFFAKQIMARPFFAPPGVPAERIETLQRAFEATMTDPEFIAEAQKMKFDISYLSGEDIHKLLDQLASAPPEVLTRARRLGGMPDP